MSSILQVKLRAGILPIVLMISIAIVVICTALIGISYYKNLQFRKNRLENQLLLNVNSGLELLKSNLDLPEDGSVVMDLYQEGKDSILIQRKKWGLFEIGIAKAFRGRHSEWLVAMLGALPDTINHVTLYLVDENLPLSIAGNTHITGNCMVPNAGIRTTTIEGNFFSGQLPNKNQIHRSKTLMPPLSSRFRPNTLSPDMNHWIVRPMDRLPSLAQYTFANTTVVFASAGSCTIEAKLVGNIWLHSDNTIILSEASQLENIVVSARKIIIREGFKGQLQALATDTIIVENNVSLRYPSVIFLHYNQQGWVDIGQHSVIEGTVMLNNESNGNSDLGAKLRVQENAHIWVEVYCNGLTEWRGKLSGSLVCRRFSLLTASALYENHLIDAYMNLNERPRSFLTSPLLSSQQRSVLKWLR